jgi:hypothetical protein
MQIRPAKDVRANCHGDPSCPEPGCPVRLSPTGTHKPVLVDADGRPYCAKHGPLRSADFKKLVETYSDARDVVAKAVNDGLMTAADATFYYGLWDGAQMDP